MNDKQRTRVLRVLRAVGSLGITQVDFLRSPTPDGGPPITRLAARINELRNAGYAIDKRGIRDACAVYVLTDDTAGTTRPHAQQAPTAAHVAPRGTDDDTESDEPVVIDGQMSMFEAAA